MTLEKTPTAWMWQHGETGMTGFLEDSPPDELARWERMNKPRKIICPLYRAACAVADTEPARSNELNPVSASPALSPQAPAGFVLAKLVLDYCHALAMRKMAEVHPVTQWNNTQLPRAKMREEMALKAMHDAALASPPPPSQTQGKE